MQRRFPSRASTSPRSLWLLVGRWRSVSRCSSRRARERQRRVENIEPAGGQSWARGSLAMSDNTPMPKPRIPARLDRSTPSSARPWSPAANHEAVFRATWNSLIKRRLARLNCRSPYRDLGSGNSASSSRSRSSNFSRSSGSGSTNSRCGMKTIIASPDRPVSADHQIRAISPQDHRARERHLCARLSISTPDAE